MLPKNAAKMIPKISNIVLQISEFRIEIHLKRIFGGDPVGFRGYVVFCPFFSRFVWRFAGFRLRRIWYIRCSLF